MVRHTLAIALAAAVLATATTHAQQATTTPARAVKPAPKPVVVEGLPTNIRVDLTITDQAGPGDPVKRSVSMLVADRQNGSVRSSGQISGGRAMPVNVNLNVDAKPTILKDGVIRLDLSLEYTPRPGNDNAMSGEGRGSLNQRLSLLVESGKATVVSQASDPTSDRKMSVEVTATQSKE